MSSWTELAQNPAADAVVSPDGVVGSVLRVSGDAVDVQLAVDAAFGIDVEDERTKARGFVRGTSVIRRNTLQGRDATRGTRSKWAICS
ncbi:MAG: hypothetical protein U0169_19020 [Polyangiaceae bacterium]